MKCEICSKDFLRLGSHIITHNMTIKEYYDKYIRKENEGICLICGKETTFRGLTKGYAEHCSLKCKGLDPKVKEKVENTCLKRYGAANVYASDYGKQRIKETCQEKYNTYHPQKSETVRNKTKQTNFKKYGSKYIFSSEYGKQKIRETNQEKYGVDNYAKTKECIIKSKDTKLKKYGNSNYNNREKAIKTCIDKYSVDNPAKYPDINRKMFDTLWSNGGYHRTEKRCYEKLLEKYPNAKYNYNKDFRYPYHCDFYIPEKDLFIELNAYWSHGGHWFDSTNQEDLDKVEYWRSKNNSFYDYAIKTWTESDLAKRECAIKNNLNYLVFWSEKEFLDWLKTI